MSNKHIAQTGASAGTWVSCNARVKCTIHSSKYHTSAEELAQVQQYVQEQTGQKITVSKLPLSSVLEYKTLSKARKQEIAANVQEPKTVDENGLYVSQDTFGRPNKLHHIASDFGKDGTASKSFRSQVSSILDKIRPSKASVEAVAAIREERLRNAAKPRPKFDPAKGVLGGVEDYGVDYMPKSQPRKQYKPASLEGTVLGGREDYGVEDEDY